MSCELIKAFIIQTIHSSGYAADLIREEFGVPNQTIKIALELITNNPIEIISKFKPIETYFCKDAILFIFTNGYEKISVSLIDTRNRPMTLFYHSYGGLGILLSKICRSIGLRLTQAGLSINLLSTNKSEVYLGPAHQEGNLILSCDPKKICDFLELDYAAWANFSFKTNYDIFRWIMTSKYYSIASELFMKMKLRAKKRASLTPFLNQFLDFIEIEAATNSYFQNKALDFFGISK